MSIGPLFSLASNYVQSLIGGTVNGSSSPSTATTSSTSASGSAQDGNQLSPFAQILSTLQQLQQSNPTEYQQVTQQISGNLQTAAQTATTAGDTNLASQLTQLSTDFSNASSSGQIPNIQDLAQAIGGGHGHHHHHGGSENSSSASGNSGAGSATTANSATTSNLSQYIQSLTASQGGSSATSSLDPLSIISSTLSSAGIPIV
jgi:hypothetical protein